MVDTVKTPYDAAKRLINASSIPNWLNDYDALRLASYELYENIYWTEPETFKLQQRGSEENPIYIPSGRIIVNTMDRYVGKNMKLTCDPAYGTPEQQAVALLTIQSLFERERFQSAFESNKLYGIMRGDWCFYITANPDKAEGSRLSLRSIDPRMVFPINPNKDSTRVIGYDIVEQVVVGDTTYINRSRYLKPEHEGHPNYVEGAPPNPLTPISYQVDILEVENWENPAEQKIFQTVTEAVLLPEGITQLPIYHIKNFEEPDNPFGSSEMRGIERLMAAINQSITDEELSLAMAGLGLYRSQKGQPRDAAGNPTTWRLGPGQVVHDETFERVSGVASVTPSQDHVEYLEDRLYRVSGASDVAQGVVDVQVAESGVALALRMGPILDTAVKKDTSIKDVLNQMLFDLRAWFKAYEGVDMEAVRPQVVFGAKLPRNVKEEFSMLLQMVTSDPPLITMAYFRDAVRELGMEIPATVTGLAIAEERAQLLELMDPYGARAAQEMEAEGVTDDGEE